MAVIVIGGAPGVGKSTVLKEALKGLGVKVEIHNFGDVILEQSGATDRDTLRKMPIAEQKQHQKAAANWLAKEGKSKAIVVDTHFIVSTPGGYMPGMPLHVLELLEPSLLVFVQCPARDLMKRRKSDETRSRDSESEKELELFLEMNRSYLAACSVVSGAVAKIVENGEGKLEDAGKALAEALKCYL